MLSSTGKSRARLAAEGEGDVEVLQRLLDVAAADPEDAGVLLHVGAAGGGGGGGAHRRLGALDVAGGFADLRDQRVAAAVGRVAAHGLAEPAQGVVLPVVAQCLHRARVQRRRVLLVPPQRRRGRIVAAAHGQQVGHLGGDDAPDQDRRQHPEQRQPQRRRGEQRSTRLGCEE
jgi:hypothetical protein